MDINMVVEKDVKVLIGLNNHFSICLLLLDSYFTMACEKAS